MSGGEFVPFPKIARLNRACIVTEKLDGTNAAITVCDRDGDLSVTAQSRTRIITPDNDHFGFAAWVRSNRRALAETLGVGTHFGEWWGGGIQRGYGLDKRDKRFSLFDVDRYMKLRLRDVPGLGIVPILSNREVFDTAGVNAVVDALRQYGSVAVPGYGRPEGVVVTHLAAGVSFKVTCERDEEWKGHRA